jgi:hypothetical protein
MIPDQKEVLHHCQLLSLMWQRVDGILGHTIAKRASGNKPSLNTKKVEGLAPYKIRDNCGMSFTVS